MSHYFPSCNNSSETNQPCVRSNNLIHPTPSFYEMWHKNLPCMSMSFVVHTQHLVLSSCSWYYWKHLLHTVWCTALTVPSYSLFHFCTVPCCDLMSLQRIKLSFCFSALLFRWLAYIPTDPAVSWSGSGLHLLFWALILCSLVYFVNYNVTKTDYISHCLFLWHCTWKQWNPTIAWIRYCSTIFINTFHARPNDLRWLFLCLIFLPIIYGLVAGLIGTIVFVQNFRFVASITSSP